MRHSPRKVRSKVHNPNPEQKLCDIPISAAVVMSPCENITSSSSPANGDIEATIMMDYGVSGNENEMNAPETAAINDDGSTSDDEEHEAMEFHYEKTGTHQFVPNIAEAEAALLFVHLQILQILILISTFITKV